MRKSLVFSNQIKEINRLEDMMSNIEDELNISQEKSYKLQLILEEILTNIIFYGYKEGEKDEIRVIMERKDESIILEVIDAAKPFDLRTKSQEPHEELLDDTPIGGLGILLIKKLSDSIDYKRDHNKNHLTIKL